MKTNAKRQKEIYRALGELEGYIHTLDESVIDLGSSIAPVLSDWPPNEPADETKSCYSAPLAKEIKRLSDKVEDIRMRVKTLNNQVEF